MFLCRYLKLDLGSKYVKILRRRFYFIFRRRYIVESVARRKGHCNHCSCCQVRIFGRKYDCRYFDERTKKCMVYKSDEMPKLCRYYPFDEKDKWDEYKDRCGFYWE